VNYSEISCYFHWELALFLLQTVFVDAFDQFFNLWKVFGENHKINVAEHLPDGFTDVKLRFSAVVGSLFCQFDLVFEEEG